MLSRSIGIYALIFPNGKVYIGSSVRSCEGRFRGHLRGLHKGCHNNPRMQRLFNKYGEPEFQILQECGDPKGMRIKEIIIRLREDKWIEAQGSDAINCGRAYPCPMFGRHHSEETLKKISEYRKGRCHSAITRKKMSKSLKSYYHSPESTENRKMLSEANKSKHVSEETRKKISESLKGRPSPMKGWHHSKETLAKMSKVHKDLWKDLCPVSL